MVKHLFSFLQLSELEQRVLEAEGRAEEAEDKVSFMNRPIRQIEIGCTRWGISQVWSLGNASHFRLLLIIFRRDAAAR